MTAEPLVRCIYAKGCANNTCCGRRKHKQAFSEQGNHCTRWHLCANADRKVRCVRAKAKP